MTDLIGSILVSSIRNLFNRQPDILTHTSATGMTEWNLGHHLANEIVKYIFWFNHDLDVMKRNYSNRRPDIIFHRRGINALNFLVVEIKIKNYIDEDIRKIKDDWMGAELDYRYGASVVVQSTDDFKVRLFERGMAGPKCFGVQAQQISSPSPNQEIALRFNRQVSRIEELEKALLRSTDSPDVSDNPFIKEQVNQIDQFVCELYGLTEEEILVVEGKNSKIREAKIL